MENSCLFCKKLIVVYDKVIFCEEKCKENYQELIKEIAKDEGEGHK